MMLAHHSLFRLHESPVPHPSMGVGKDGRARGRLCVRDLTRSAPPIPAADPLHGAETRDLGRRGAPSRDRISLIAEPFDAGRQKPADRIASKDIA